MFKALYSFRSSDENALSFGEGDTFTLIDSEKDTHWWLVQNGMGQVGFVPANYLQRDEGTVADVLKSIERAMASIHLEGSTKPGGYTTLQRANLQKLEKHRDNVLAQQQHAGSHSQNLHLHHIMGPPPHQTHNTSNRKSTRAAPPPPPVRDSKNDGLKQTNNLHQNKKEQNISNNCNLKDDTDNVTSDSAKKFIESENSAACSSIVSATDLDESSKNEEVCLKTVISMTKVNIPSELGSELVEKIRTSTGLSHKSCINAVNIVLSHVKQRVPELNKYMEDILKTLHVESGISSVDLTTDDAKKLLHIFEELANCKDDSQQRSWFLHEDEHIITNLLEELLSILNGANSDICKTIVAKDHYDAVNNLVLYYQMETRINLRMLLLKVFGSLCGLSSKIISELLNSVLTSELARDIQTDTDEIQKFCYSSLVLTMIFSQGESVPLQYYTQLNQTFIHYLLENIENPPENDAGEQVPDLLLNLVLSFNLHFELPQENTVMKVLAERRTAKVLTEKLLLLVNRGDDPVRMFDHRPKPPNAVLKFLSDLYSTSSTSNLLYTNDVKVLIDIVLRQLNDLSPGEMLRTEYLSILELLLRNHCYLEHCHRQKELEVCFKQIYNEEDSSTDMDKRIILQIWKDLPDLFESDYV